MNIVSVRLPSGSATSQDQTTPPQESAAKLKFRHHSLPCWSAVSRFCKHNVATLRLWLLHLWLKVAGKNYKTAINTKRPEFAAKVATAGGDHQDGKGNSSDQRRPEVWVYLIGAGPGDPELLTVKAQRLLSQADVLLYDNLVSPALLSMVPAHCRQLYVGKRAGQHAMSQAQINQLLVATAQAALHQMAQHSKSNNSKVIVRLKGGDPAIFGRVAEEAAALQQAGIQFAIVPGVTSACAAAAYCGFALTQRGVAASVQFLTAQFADSSKEPDWQSYAWRGQGNNATLVVYMGLNKLQQLSQGLLAVGWPADTAIALLDKVSTGEQQQLQGVLANIHQLYQQKQQSSSKFSGPTLIVIGEVLQQPMAVNPLLLQAGFLTAQQKLTT